MEGRIRAEILRRLRLLGRGKIKNLMDARDEIFGNPTFSREHLREIQSDLNYFLYAYATVKNVLIFVSKKSPEKILKFNRNIDSN